LPEWNERSVSMIISLKSVITRYPTSFGLWAQLAQWQIKDLAEIAVVGEKAADYRRELLPFYFPNKVLQTSLKDDENFPLLRNRLQRNTLVYHCINYVCKQPYETTEAFLSSLHK
jgi:uncharacterized protein